MTRTPPPSIDVGVLLCKGSTFLALLSLLEEPERDAGTSRETEIGTSLALRAPAAGFVAGYVRGISLAVVDPAVKSVAEEEVESGGVLSEGKGVSLANLVGCIEGDATGTGNELTEDEAGMEAMSISGTGGVRTGCTMSASTLMDGLGDTSSGIDGSRDRFPSAKSIAREVAWSISKRIVSSWAASFSFAARKLSAPAKVRLKSEICESRSSIMDF